MVILFELRLQIIVMNITQNLSIAQSFIYAICLHVRHHIAEDTWLCACVSRFDLLYKVTVSSKTFSDLWMFNCSPTNNGPDSRSATKNIASKTLMIISACPPTPNKTWSKAEKENNEPKQIT